MRLQRSSRVRHRLSVAGAVLAVSVAALSLGVAPATTAPASLTPSTPAPANLEQTMKAMNRSLKAIDRQLDDPKQDASTLSLINALQTSTVAAKNIYPDDVGDVTGDARTKAIADYRTRMIALIRTELTLEDALLRNDRHAARDAFAALGQQRKDGHDAYGVEDHQH